MTIKKDPALFGLGFVTLGAILFYAMYFIKMKSGIWGLTVGAFNMSFGSFGWMAPLNMILIGSVMVVEGKAIRSLYPMSLGALLSTILMSTYYNTGIVGKTVFFFSTVVSQDFAWTILGVSSGVLFWAMSGIRVRAIPGFLWNGFNSCLIVLLNISYTPKPKKLLALTGPKAVSATIVEPISEATFSEALPRTKQAYMIPGLDSLISPKPYIEAPVASGNDKKIVACLASFKSPVHVTVRPPVVGPSVIQYQLALKKGTQVSQILNKADDLALALATEKVRIQAPIPGLSLVGIEIANPKPRTVTMKEVFEKIKPNRNAIEIVIGQDINGQAITYDLTKFPHLLAAGATGSGKSVFLNILICSVLLSKTPEEVQLLLIDPKRVELTVYDGIPHLIGGSVITKSDRAIGALQEVIRTMDERYDILQKNNVRKIEEYNKKFPNKRMSFIVVVIDEFAMVIDDVGEKLEKAIERLSALSRATGIHLVFATQNPLVKYISGAIKANTPSRIAFAVSGNQESRNILDRAGAEDLLGQGDMLFHPQGLPSPKRVQGAYITTEEVNSIVGGWSKQVCNKNKFDEKVEEAVHQQEVLKHDPLLVEIATYVVEQGKAVKSEVQTLFKKHPRTVTPIFNELVAKGILEEQGDKKPWKVIVDKQGLEAILHG